METLANCISRCEQCGALLKTETTCLGCLNCLLLGVPNEPSPECHRFQHYEICTRDDGAILDELGRGAMGITYRARDTNLDSIVALKIISTRNCDDPKARERFRREARAAAQLRHRNIARVFHFGETEAGRCFYAMELIEGETVEARIRREGCLPPILALEIAAQVARALTAAESHRLVHRDLKPSNLMIVAGDADDCDSLVVKVIDFGLAKAVAVAPFDPDRVNAGFSGTPEFASPEQLSSSQALLDTRSDIYSLGATLWYLLCGEPPFVDRASGELRCQTLPLEQLALVHTPYPVITLLNSMLAVDPFQRPPSARELLGLIQRCLQVLENPSFSFA